VLSFGGIDFVVRTTSTPGVIDDFGLAFEAITRYLPGLLICWFHLLACYGRPGRHVGLLSSQEGLPPLVCTFLFLGVRFEWNVFGYRIRIYNI